MQFVYSQIEGFPPLAWVASSQPGREEITVLHGRFVETRPHFFVEGAWAGDFAEGQIQNSDTVFGSGGVLGDEAVTFVSCTATTDYLYHSDDANHFVISNSLPLLLARLGDALQSACEDYSRINMSILDGFYDFTSEIPTRKGHARRVMHHNVYLDSSGIVLLEKPYAPDFSSFNEYRDYLRLRIGLLFANARNGARHLPLQVYSTQSRGYDSTAVNALAAPFGVDRVFTSPESKDKQSFYLGGDSQAPSDDGTAICEVLGLSCASIDRRSFEKKPLTHELYYWAGLDNNQDLNLHEITEYISTPTLLLTGQYGEFWYPRDSAGEQRLHCLDDGLKKWDQAGHGLAEVRLKTGLIQAAIPVIGSRHRTSILSITEDQEMTPWRLGNYYDRPIPRRIAEEAGVPREMFGQTKLASIVHLPTPNVPVTKALRTEFFRYLRQQGLLGWVGVWLLPLVQRLNNWVYWNNPSRYFYDRRKYPLLWYISYASARLFGKPLHIRMAWTRLDSFLYAFCVNKVRDEYAAQLETIKPDGDLG
ncbi:MAG: hypothetical protein Q7V00_04645 [Sulfurimicrobium sp.]|nr:hypothetical protein [Sulfurimicrobium sp.]MDP1704658.1 hypothetical protein [Sulfurimicrobium sp.]MDP2197064.1 hypothetical protein [Sulfurimicrobium sp.]MDP3687492.1 hypothetical protein [Sulfurimicrobium sp.]MDZ7657078.1 hypothetical protein [Sulfurimicrobium sp.]